MKITLNKSDVGLLSIITEQVQTNLFKFRLSTTVVEGHIISKGSYLKLGESSSV